MQKLLIGLLLLCGMAVVPMQEPKSESMSSKYTIMLACIFSTSISTSIVGLYFGQDPLLMAIGIASGSLCLGSLILLNCIFYNKKFRVAHPVLYPTDSFFGPEAI